MADGYADDGLDWYRQFVAGGPNDPYGSAGNLPGSGPSGYPQASGRGPYMGYQALQNPFPAQPQVAAPQQSLMQRLLNSINPISSAQAAEVAPAPAPATTPGITLTHNPVTSSEGAAEATPMLDEILRQHANATPNLDKAIEATPKPGAAPESAAAPESSAVSGGLAAVAPAATLLSGLESGNAGIRRIQQEAARQRAIAASADTPTSTTLPTGLPQVQPQPQPQPQRAPPVPPASTIFGGPPGPPPPIVQAPIPTGQPHMGGHPAYAGAARRQPVGALADSSVTGGAAAPSPGEYFATTGNARGASWTPGGFASPPAQHFQTPLTPMFGPGQWIGGPQPGPAAPQVVGRGAPQGGYNVGGLFANLPNDVFNGAGGGAQAPTRVARAPVMRRQPMIQDYPPGTGYAGGL
jgi:hypothetical protein